MEFWGIEVKSGKPLKVNPGNGWLVHVSQAALGEASKSEKGNDSVLIFVSVGEKKLVLGTLSSTNFPHIPFDLVFDSEFELSHNWKNGSVYFTGYKTEISGRFDSDSEPESDSEDVPLPLTMNGSLADKTVVPKAKEVKIDNSKTKTGKEEKAKKDEKIKKNEKVKIDVSDDDDDEDDDDSSDEDDDDSEDDSDEMKMDADSDEDVKDITSDEEDESAKKKTPVSKKRPNDASADMPKSKKEKHSPRVIGTPHPSKGPAAKSGKKAAPAKAVTATPPASGDSKFNCGSCGKNLKSAGGLACHLKDKHDIVA